jgi:hypothetical protein
MGQALQINGFIGIAPTSENLSEYSVFSKLSSQIGKIHSIEWSLSL